MTFRNTLLFGALAGLLALATPKDAAAQQAERPFRFVVNVGLQNLDPITSPSFVTRNFAYLVFDTLVAMDGQGRFRPQMLEGWTVSQDQLTWVFKLRPGLLFHDGSKVTAEDVVASLKRWGARDAIGRRLMAATQELQVIEPDTFAIVLSRPFGGVIEALGKPSVHVPFIMPARIASETPPTTTVREIMGSGPFLFDRNTWIPGEKAIFRRNPAYVPRSEPADGLAGGKVAKVEHVEMLTLPDPGLRAAALQQGEVDYLEYVPIDHLPRLQRNRNIVVSQAAGQAQMMYAVSINHNLAPFNDVRMRRALQQVLDRGEILAGAGFPAELAQPGCLSLFMCGTTFSSERGADVIRAPSLDRARSLLREAGYNNERVVVMLPADSILLNPFGLVLIDRMKRAGFNVDVQAQDWSSIAQRWVQREPLDRGGWNVVPVVYTGFDMADPLSNLGTGYNCSGNQPWGYCSEAMKPLIERFEAESDLEKRRAIAAEIQEAAIADVTFPIAGQFRRPAAWRAELRGVIDFGFPVIWNIERPAR
jgi:peptide/nickel transport system substrate-binding protein